MNRTQIIEAVEALRQRKCRPEKEAIAHYIIRKYGTQFQEIFSDLETIVDQGDLIKVEYKGTTSYRSPQIFHTQASPLLTKHSKILNSNKTIRFILTSVSELLAENDTYTKEGIPLEDIQVKLIGYDSTRFTSETVDIFIRREVAVGTLVEGPNKRLFHKDFPLPEGINNYPSPPKRKMRGRKSAAAIAAAAKSAETTPVSSSFGSGNNVSEIFAVKSVPTPHPIPPTKPVRAYGRKSTAAAAAAAAAAAVVAEKQKAEADVKNSDDKTAMPTLSNCADDSNIQLKNNGDKMPCLTTPEETSTGRSVRNKRKKEVFDPSDLPKKKSTVVMSPTVIPKIEKEKPVSKIKTTPPSQPKSTKKPGRKKKQPAEEEASANTLCEHCQRHKNIKSQVETFLTCSDCSVTYHPSCLDYDKKQATLLVEKGTWQCSECRACQVCQEQSSKGPETILCSTCDMGFHYKCLKLNKKPSEDSWLCPGCKGDVEQDKEKQDENTMEVTLELVETVEDIKEEVVEEPPPPAVIPDEFIVTEAVKKKPTVKAGRSPPKKRIITLHLNKEEEKGANMKEEKEAEASIKIEAAPLPSSSEVKKETKEIDSIPSEACKWTPSQVEAYFKKHGLCEEGALFREQEIDGLSLLLMRRQDIVNGMKLLLGPALKVFKLVVMLQQSGGKVEESIL